MEYEIKDWGNDGLQGQQPSAQGNALDISNKRRAMAACKAKRTILSIKLLPFQGVYTPYSQCPRVLPWAMSSLAV